MPTSRCTYMRAVSSKDSSRSSKVEKFLNGIQADQTWRSKVESFHQFKYEAKNRKLLLEAKDLKGYLPETMIQEVLLAHFKDHLGPIFIDIKSQNFMLELCYVLTNRIFMPGDYVVKKDEYGEEMFFIIDGSVQILGSDHYIILNTLTACQSFGEVALLLGLKRISNVRSQTFSILSVLKDVDLKRILISFPGLKTVFESLAKQRLEDSLKVEAKQAIRQKFKALRTKWKVDEGLEKMLRVSDEDEKTIVNETMESNHLLIKKQEETNGNLSE